MSIITIPVERTMMSLTRGVTTPNRRAFLAASVGLLGAGLAERVIGAPVTQSGTIEVVSAHRRPMFIERVGLRVRDVAGVIPFYEKVIGLEIMGREESGALLGIHGVGLIELVQQPSATQAPPGGAGLYHIAFEMPTRRDLARWVVHAASNRYRVTGLADHRVTESVYLNDPEGNGVEVYADRAESQWEWSAGQVAMGVFDLDLDDLMKLADRAQDDYVTAPAAMRIGHIHLKGGDLTAAERFYSTLIGLDVTRRAPGVIFMSSGRYHHHMAVNMWESAQAKMRDEEEAGLIWFSIAVADQAILDAQESRLREAGLLVQKTAEMMEVADPWGNKVRLRPVGNASPW